MDSDDEFEEVFVDVPVDGGGDSDLEFLGSSPSSGKNTKSRGTLSVLSDLISHRMEAGPSSRTDRNSANVQQSKSKSNALSDSDSEGGIDWEQVDLDSVMTPSTPSTSQQQRIQIPSAPNLTAPRTTLMDKFEAVESSKESGEALTGDKRRRVSDAEGDQERHEKGSRVDGDGVWKDVTSDQVSPISFSCYRQESKS